MRLFVLFTFLVLNLISACKHRNFDSSKVRSEDAVGPEMESRDFDAQYLSF
jgi:hypothetical protein